jgi:hypothetical protein
LFKRIRASKWVVKTISRRHVTTSHVTTSHVTTSHVTTSHVTTTGHVTTSRKWIPSWGSRPGEEVIGRRWPILIRIAEDLSGAAVRISFLGHECRPVAALIEDQATRRLRR